MRKFDVKSLRVMAKILGVTCGFKCEKTVCCLYCKHLPVCYEEWMTKNTFYCKTTSDHMRWCTGARDIVMKMLDDKRKLGKYSTYPRSFMRKKHGS